MTKKSGSRKAPPAINVDNEADFQAAIVAKLRAALPLLPADIRVERYLHLKLGHHEIVIDGASNVRGSTRGRLDVAVFRDNAPLLLAELKAPNVALTEEDVDQGLSYARIHRPMIPLILVTNGADTRLIRTYDGSRLSVDQVDEGALSKILASASMLAATALEGAIRGLLGSDPEVWAKILDRWNNDAIASRTGSAGDFGRSITSNFSIPREAVKSVSDLLAGGASVVILHGPPLSGVSNVLTQLVLALREVPSIYVDTRSSGDVLQFLASRLTRELNFGISKDDLRQWLNSGQALRGLTLLMDGIPSGAMEELLQVAETGALKVVFGVDSWVFSLLKTYSGRAEESTLARMAKEVELKELSVVELNAAKDVLLNSFSAAFLPGSQFVRALRVPRILRLLAAQIPSSPPTAGTKKKKNSESISAYTLPPIPTTDLLARVGLLFGTQPQLKHDLSRLAKAYLADLRRNGTDRDRIVDTFGIPSLDPDLCEREIGENRFQRLSDQGFIEWSDTRLLGPRIVFRIPELLAHHVSLHWRKQLNKADSKKAALTALNEILKISSLVPHGDLCVASAVSKVEDGKLLHVILHSLLERAPQASHNEGRALVELLATDKKGIRFEIDDGWRTPGDMQPWLVLSHIAVLHAEWGDMGNSVNMGIIANIGNSEDLIFSPPPGKLEELVGFHFHDVPGLGSLPCPASGIIEPIQQAMYLHALRRPAEFETLVNFSIDEKKAFLAWRLMMVARLVVNAIDPNASKVASRALALLGKWWHKTYGASVSH